MLKNLSYIKALLKVLTKILKDREKLATNFCLDFEKMKNLKDIEAFSCLQISSAFF